MPITLSIINHSTTAWKAPQVETPEDLLKYTSPRNHQRYQRIIQASFYNNLMQESNISPSKNGFIWSAYYAYSQHHHLTIRPEDIWFAILTQISFFVNTNANDLRSFLVNYDS